MYDQRVRFYSSIIEQLTRGKRKTGIITELFFEKYFSDRFTEKSAKGAIKIDQRNDGNFDLFYPAEERGKAPESLVKLASQANAKIYIVSLNVDLISSQSSAILVEEFHEGSFIKDKDKSEEFSNSVKTWFDNAFNSRKEASHLSGYLERMTELSSSRLVLSRLLLDVVFRYQNPVDIDAVDIRANDLLVIYEFKRKPPAYNLISITGDNELTFANLRHIHELAEQVIGKIVKRYPEERYGFLQGEFSKELNRLSSSGQLNGFRFSSPIPEMYNFSLDYSHIKNVELSERIGAKYVYVVWDQKCKNMDEMKRLLNFELRPLAHFDFKVCKEVSMANAKGITFTTGPDNGDVQSGSFRPRVQFTFLNDCFNPLRNIRN